MAILKSIRSQIEKWEGCRCGIHNAHCPHGTCPGLSRPAALVRAARISERLSRRWRSEAADLADAESTSSSGGNERESE